MTDAEGNFIFRLLNDSLIKSVFFADSLVAFMYKIEVRFVTHAKAWAVILEALYI